MRIEQFVMAYNVEQDRLRAMLPEGFSSLRPVLRFNGEIRGGKLGYLELNTPVEGFGKRGWLNIARWNGKVNAVSFVREERKVTFYNPFAEITFAPVGIRGGCPAEKDNDGCFYPSCGQYAFLPAEKITENKEFCDCSFRFLFPGGAFGVSEGKTLPAFYEEPETAYEKQPFTFETAGLIPCRTVLGAYTVAFERDVE
ncbi:MAG: hypothetical protein IJO10_01290 [Clostridia bacterium]|nr:hypothetical protein [Clostridia bacterium]